ncbi:MAG TPA: hypothetical protein VFZ25_14790 [Chloroflexota bacterium]|nr:hypothetical protein [Chloroflexota bacterium]
MSEQGITGDTPVADVLAMVPGARALFRKHGADPEVARRALTRAVPMRDAGAEFELRDLKGLIAELNLLLALEASSAP